MQGVDFERFVDPKDLLPEGKLREYVASLDDNPLFATEAPTEEERKSNPYWASIDAIDYDEDNTPYSLALEAKEDGNNAFRKGPTFFGNALRFYKEGLRHIAKADASRKKVRTLHSQLFSNRAALFLARKQYTQCVTDCTSALKLWPENPKACYRAAQACLAHGWLDEATKFVRAGLRIEPEAADMKALAEKVGEAQAVIERRKKQEAEERARADDLLELAKAHCDGRGIRMGLPVEPLIRKYCAPPEIDEDSTMHWRVLFLYPQVSQHDFVESVSELSTLGQQLEVMFPDDGSGAAPWDKANEYRASNLEVYFRTGIPPVPRHLAWCNLDSEELTEYAASLKPDHTPNAWIKVPLDVQLVILLRSAPYVVPFIPLFYVVARGSPTHAAIIADRNTKPLVPQYPDGE